MVAVLMLTHAGLSGRSQHQCQEELQSRNVHLHREYSQKIDNLVSVIKDCQEELQTRNVEVNEISAALEKTESSS
jgi:predicted HTH domain antitoxin